jgi:hypothetical protein
MSLSEFFEYQRLVREFATTRGSFVDFVREMSIDGLIIEADGVTVHPSTELHKKCGATSISGFSKYDGSCFEIALRNSEDELLSAEEARAVGLEDQVHILEKKELRDFLVKLVSQTK